MKQFLLFGFMLLCSFSVRAQRTDTLYYDNERIVVDDPLFATYYRIVRIPAKPGLPLRFKEFDMNGTLSADGIAASIDSLDDANSVYRQVSMYYPNGKKQKEFVFRDGKLHGVQREYYENGVLRSAITYADDKLHGEQQEYYETGTLRLAINNLNGKLHGIQKEYYNNGQLQSAINYVNGEQNGLLQIFTKDGAVVMDGISENDLFTGVKNEYADGAISTSTNFVRNIRHGKTVEYSNGKPVYEAVYNHGVLDGSMRKFGKNGVLVGLTEYKAGLPVGRSEDREDGSVLRLLNKEMISPGNLPIRISASFRPMSLPTSMGAGRVGFLTALAGALTGTELEGEQVEHYTHFYRFELNFWNNADSLISCDLGRIYVAFIKSGKRSKNNRAMSQKLLTAIVEKYASYSKQKAYKKAADTAEAAATQSSSVSNFGASYASRRTNTQSSAQAGASSSSASASASGAVGAAYGANNQGYAAGVVGGVVGRAVGAAVAQTNASGSYSGQSSGRTSSFSHSYSSTSSSSKDGYLQYQIYAQERKQADQLAESLNDTVIEVAEMADYHFALGPSSLVRKWVGVLPEKKKKQAFDKVCISFTVNDEPYMLEFDYASELNL